VPFSYSITVATSVFVVLYVGLAFQAFQLLMPTRGSTMFALFLFFAWLVPLILGAIISGSNANVVLAQGILSLSPIMGLAYAAGAGASESVRVAQVAVFLPAFVFAFVFNNLVVIGRRKLNSQAKGEAKPHAVAAEV
jgi:hypothetical protein